MSKHITAADKIRTDLKNAGYSARKVTVKMSHSTVTVTIRDASVKLSAVAAIANVYEKVDRCSVTGEILLGGNTYVDVKYHASVTEALAKEIEARILAAGSSTIEIGARAVCADIEGTYPSAANDAKVWTISETGCGSIYCVGVRHAASRLAVELLDAGITELAPATTTEEAA